MSEPGMAALVLLAVMGVAALFYSLFEWLMRPKDTLPLLLLGFPKDIQSLLSLCDRLQVLRHRGLDARLFVLDHQLGEETRRAASLLAQDDSGVELWNTEDLCAYVAGNLGGTNPFSHLQQ